MKIQLPDRIKIGDMLFLKCVSLEDSEYFFNILQENQAHFSKFEFQAPSFSNLSELKSAIKNLVDYKNNCSGASYGLWKQTNLVGLLTINKIDWNNQVSDIGIWLIESATNSGVAFKAMLSLVHTCWDILNMKSITAHTAVSNIKCQRLLEKLSFTKIQLLKNNIKVRNKYVDEYHYQLIKI